jgi:hypothetical protein
MDSGETAGGRKDDGGRRRRSLWKSPALVAVVIVAGLLLASRLVDGWHWPPQAFVVVGALIFGIGFTYELVTRNREAIAYRAGVGIAFATGFILLWGNLVQWADVNPAAVMYFVVPVVGIIGAILARFRPSGMARALFVTALAQALVVAAVLVMLITRNNQIAPWTPSVLRGFGGNAVNAMLFLVSALLFRKAAREESALGAV